MTRTTAFSLGTLAALSVACGTAHADRIATTQRPVLLSSKTAPSAYRVELVDGRGRQLPTYARGNRFYVLGNKGLRYSIRIHNPTSRRIEAVVSVDGLDVIDGKSANYRNKRGYVVPPHDSVVIEGFRTSTQNVAAFRFSSVARSYAGRKGKARNVGVIGVAIFEEKATAAIVTPRPHHRRWRGDYRDYLQDHDDYRPRPRPRGQGKSSSKKRPAPPVDADAPSADLAPSEESVAGGSAGSRSRPAPRRYRREHRWNRDHSQRPGLGTEFGESRYSTVTWTRFQRKSNRPDAIAQLRYNNATGLAALGIHIPNRWDHEVATRETANPFPGEFSSPPPGYR